MNSYCIFEGDNHFEALSAKEILENHNIYCIMPNEHLTGAVPYYSSFTGGFKIIVSEKEIENAKTILTDFGFLNKDLREPESNLALKEYTLCPKCGKNSLEIIGKNNRKLIILLFLLFSIPVPAKYNVYECQTCGYREKYKNTDKI